MRTPILQALRGARRRYALRCAAAAVTVLGSLLVAQAAKAQTTGPGQLEREFSAPPALPSGEGLEVPATPTQRPPADADQVRFTLARLEVVDSTAYSAAELEAAAQPLLGREISLADVFRLAEQLTLKYRNDGYVLSRVIVPPQRIRDGMVRLQAVEGHIAQARVQGRSAGPQSLVDQHLQAIRASRPLAASVLERELLLVNDLPGVTARTTIGPSETPSASDLTVDLSEQRLSWSAGFGNRGSRSLGPWRIDLSADANQLLGGYDRLSGRLIRTVPDDELTFLSAGYERTLGAGGTRAGINLSAVEAEPGGDQNLQLPTSSRSGTLSLQHPVLRSRARNLNLRAALSVLRSRTEADVGDVSLTVSDESITALRLGASFDAIDSFGGVSVLDAELSRGLDAFGASKAGDAELSVQGGQPEFTKLTLYLARLQSIAPQWSLLAAINAQYGGNVLLSPERFGFGGEQFGRAYDTAELTGDSGIAFKGELRYGASTAGWLRDYTAYAFYEIGAVHRRPASTSGTGQESRESAADAGIGLRFSARRLWSGYLELAVPLTRDVAQEGNRDPRVFIGLQMAM